MQLPGMFDPKNYRSERVVNCFALLPQKQAGFLCGFGILVGGPVALVAMLTFLTLKSVPIDLMLCVTGMFLGMLLFMLGITIPYFVYLAKELTKLQRCVRAIQFIGECNPTENRLEVEQVADGNPR